MEAFEQHVAGLPSTETRAAGLDDGLLDAIRSASLSHDIPMIHTTAGPPTQLLTEIGLETGAEVTVAPNDTGRADPTVGTLVAMSPEEVAISPRRVGNAVDVRIHFPRVGFVVRRQK